MASSKAKVVLFVVSGFVLPGASIAIAEESGRKIEEVIVTAERREASIQDTSMSITAFTTEFMDDFGIRNQEDLQNFVPATTIQPYDATIRGVGRNFRALGGDPGVATYMNGVYSEDLLTATAQTFWDVDRVEVLRGPQGTLYGRNAVGGAINMIWKKPTQDVDWALKAIMGNTGQAETYGMLNGPLSETLSGRMNFSKRKRDGVIEDLGGTRDLDGQGVTNFSGQIQWDPSDKWALNIRHNGMRVDRTFGGANGGGLVVLNEEGRPERVFHALVPGYRAVDPAQTAPLANDFLVPNAPVYTFTDPNTGAEVQAQNNRAGIDFADFDGFQNAAASLDGFNYSSQESMDAYNACVFSGDINGSDLCAATNGFQREEFEADTTQLNLTYQLTDDIELKYIYGLNELMYRRTTDDDNTASQFHDRQFYVNHEAAYESHELVVVVDFSEDFSLTSGIYFYDATIDQRGDFYSSVGERRFIDPYLFSTAIFGPGPMTTLHGARASCEGSTAFGCNRNDSLQDPDAYNLQLSAWLGDPGTDPDLDVKWGPNTLGSDLLYHTQTKRKAFAAYSQGVWQLNEKFALTVGLRYASDELVAEENLWRYSETGGDDGNFIPAIFGSLAVMNMANGGFETDASLVSDANPFGVIYDEYGQPTPTRLAVNGGTPFSLSIYRPFERKDTKTTFRVNLDYDITDNAMIYTSVTSGHRAGGYNLVFFSNTPTYEPEQLIAYEIGYKTQWMDNSLQLNGSFYYYDYENIHTVATEVSEFFGTSTTTLAAPGAEIKGIEAELTWLVTDRLTLGGNFSFTPNEYSEDLIMLDPVRSEAPPSLFGAVQSASNINGNQLLQVPESKFNGWVTHVTPLPSGSTLMFTGSYSWIDEVFYSPFQNDSDKAADYGRLDLRASWTSADGKMLVSGFVNNVLDDVGVLQVLREGEGEHFRQSAGTTLPRMMGIEFTVSMNSLK
ncbi:TonB-dependent receptor [Pseudomonadales bacterium]|nr:TonB-dependent receptor [Pseudomonadales bacterium]